MQIETQVRNGRTISFIVADNIGEANQIEAVARENAVLKAVVETSTNYLYPYIKIIYERVLP